MKRIKKILQNNIVKLFLEYASIYFSMFGAGVALFWIFIEDKNMVYLISSLLSLVALIAATTQEIIQNKIKSQIESANTLDEKLINYQQPSKLVLEIKDRVFKATQAEIDVDFVMDAIECAQEELDIYDVKLMPRAKRRWVSDFAYAHLLSSLARVRGRFVDIPPMTERNNKELLNTSTEIKNRLFKELEDEYQWRN